MLVRMLIGVDISIDRLMIIRLFSSVLCRLLLFEFGVGVSVVKNLVSMLVMLFENSIYRIYNSMNRFSIMVDMDRVRLMKLVCWW